MKKVFTIMLALILSLNIVACNKSLSKETRGDEAIYSVKSEDKEMNLIIKQARESVNDFLKELNNPKTKVTEFSVKYPFDTDPGSKNSIEHIWLADIKKINDKYYGIVANDPFYIKNMKMGDKVEFDIKKVSDWKYVENGYLVGGKSIVYFYDKMSENEKKDFEKEAGFKIKGK